MKSEVEEFGVPPKFPEEDPEIRAQMEAKLQADADAKAAKAAESGNKSKGSKSIALSKKIQTNTVKAKGATNLRLLAL